MVKVAFARGKYLNLYEGQNYIFSKKDGISLCGISSLRPIHRKLPFSVLRLPSIADIGEYRMLKAVLNRTLGDSQVLFGLESMIEDFDVFHSADPHYYYSYQLAKIRSKRADKKLILTSWESIPFNNESVWRKKFIKRFTMRQADLFLCHTERAKRCLMKEGIGEKKIQTVRLGVNLKRFKSQRSKVKSFKILFVGRLVEEKGMMDLYEAFKRAKNIERRTGNRNLELRIVGSGPLRGRLSKLMQRDGFGNAAKIEKRGYGEMAGVYRDADIFVLPSRTTETWEEQYGIVLVEAMASGLPIVAYASGAIPEVLANAGILVKEGDISGLSGAIHATINKPDLRIKLGTMGRKRAETFFDARKTARKIKKIYDAVMRDSHKK